MPEAFDAGWCADFVAGVNARRTGFSVLTDGPTARVLLMGRKEEGEEVRDSGRRKVSVVARLLVGPAVCSKTTRLMTPRDDRYGMTVFLVVGIMVVRRSVPGMRTINLHSKLEGRKCHCITFLNNKSPHMFQPPTWRTSRQYLPKVEPCMKDCECHTDTLRIVQWVTQTQIITPCEADVSSRQKISQISERCSGLPNLESEFVFRQTTSIMLSAGRVASVSGSDYSELRCLLDKPVLLRRVEFSRHMHGSLHPFLSILDVCRECRFSPNKLLRNLLEFFTGYRRVIFRKAVRPMAVNVCNPDNPDTDNVNSELEAAQCLRRERTDRKIALSIFRQVMEPMLKDASGVTAYLVSSLLVPTSMDCGSTLMGCSVVVKNGFRMRGEICTSCIQSIRCPRFMIDEHGRQKILIQSNAYQHLQT
ncbi:hypothetical protein CLF_106716 [Clonorchis sinensis]|uniref:Uncharacterized protein n=1 Tax=Clonorchis sinensis TaxID=79923 RepID=G7YFK1_CLOSI|nr:hypothetical protein CLF_106716 [Clonorchis sinensis]